MKVTIALSALALTLSSYSADNEKVLRSPEYTAQLTIEALRNASFREYENLFPTLNELKNVMDEHASFYGENLDEAKRDFAKVFKRETRQALSKSFEQLLSDGKARGINWQEVTFLRVENPLIEGSSLQTNLLIVFSHQGVEYIIKVKDALFINGKWRVSQYTKLM